MYEGKGRRCQGREVREKGVEEWKSDKGEGDEWRQEAKADGGYKVDNQVSVKGKTEEKDGWKWGKNGSCHMS